MLPAALATLSRRPTAHNRKPRVPVATGCDLSADRRGGVATLAAVGMTALIGMSAFAIDLGAAYAQPAALQEADSAAMAGTISWVKAGSATAVTATVKDLVLANGWTVGAVKTIAAPTTANPQVTVSLAAPSSLFFGRALSANTSITTTGYSISKIESASTPACLVALSQLMINGSVNVNGCAAVANATSSCCAITVSGGGSLTASTIATPGGLVKNGTVVGTVETGSVAATDPYSGYQSQASSGFTACQNTTKTTLSGGGCYSNVSVNSGSTLTLTAGTYFFPSLSVNGGTISGTAGVTIVIQNDPSPSGNLAITAPTTGNWAGMAIFAMGGMNANSPITYNINGAMYSPTSTINLNSGTWNASACTYIVASVIQVNSGANFTLPQSGCGTYPYPAPGISSGTLIALTQ